MVQREKGGEDSQAELTPREATKRRWAEMNLDERDPSGNDEDGTRSSV